MARYSNIPPRKGSNPTINVQDRILRYTTVKYPQISKTFDDLYVYIKSGDRYDTLANAYYSDPSLWWVISIANYGTKQDSLIPPIGSQTRIPAPSRLPSILASYEYLNKV
tara:strand:- start:565 stop:894 length:330 start_codon:yes stop_codon:yes gene_type:complete